jgi:hypothetical protein
MIQLGKVNIDPIAYGSQGNAILGIRDSGKTYTATMLAEQLFENNVPFIAFDPIGVWKWLRVPGKGRGYPIVVAGGADGDLPLTVESAPEIVRAAMLNGVSLVIDLFDINLSKADWRRIVKSCVRTLLHENQSHGLRHIFIEEAAEFVPQKVLDGDVYAEIEKLARMGGNCRLGYTLINQRAQEVSKAVLELCENLFLHRQRGKNALDSLHKWLDAADVGTAKAVMKTLPDLPKGECWAWMGGDHPQPPVRVKVPLKNSSHPDRRVMRGDAQMHEVAVNVSDFVDQLKAVLGKKAKPMLSGNADRAAIRLDRENAETWSGLDERERRIATDNGRALGRMEIRDELGPQLKSLLDTAGALAGETKELAGRASGLLDSLQGFVGAFHDFGTIDRLRIAQQNPPGSPPPTGPARAAGDAQQRHVPARKAQERAPLSVANGNGTLPRSQQRIIASLAFWVALGEHSPKREAVAGVAGYAPRSGGFNNTIGKMHEADLVGLPGRGTVGLTALGATHITGGTLSKDAASHALYRMLKGPQARVLQAAIKSGARMLDRQSLAKLSGYSPGSGGFNNLVGRLCSIDVLTKPAAGNVALSDWVRRIVE